MAWPCSACSDGGVFARASGWALLALGTAGCFGSEVTEFPDGMEPLEENLAPEPAGDFPEAIAFASGERDGLYWVHGRGYVHAPISEVMAALSRPDVVVDRRGVDEWSVQQDVEDGFDLSFAITTTVRDIITVEWTTTWRYLVVDGVLTAPEVLAIRYQKTDGIALIDTFQGSIVATRLEEELTRIELIEHLDAPNTSEDDLLCYQQDLFDELVLVTNGEELPEYEDSCR